MQRKVDAGATRFAAVMLEPVKCSLGEFESRSEAELMLVTMAVTVGNVKGEVLPVLWKKGA